MAATRDIQHADGLLAFRRVFGDVGGDGERAGQASTASSAASRGGAGRLAGSSGTDKGDPLLRASDKILERIAAQVRLEGTRVVSAMDREADGFELFDWIREQPGRAHLPIAMSRVSERAGTRRPHKQLAAATCKLTDRRPQRRGLRQWRHDCDRRAWRRLHRARGTLVGVQGIHCHIQVSGLLDGLCPATQTPRASGAIQPVESLRDRLPLALEGVWRKACDWPCVLGCLIAPL